MEGERCHRPHLVVVLCGIPGSGKSTFAAQLLPVLEQAVLVSFDDDHLPSHEVIMTETGSYAASRREGLQRVRELCDEKCAPRVVVVDDNMYYKSMRKEVYKIARDSGAAFAQIFFPVDLEEALRRNAARAEGVPEDAILRMHQRLEPPCSKSGWDKALVFAGNMEETVGALRMMWGSWRENGKEEKTEEVQTDAHALDLQLRKEVGRLKKEKGATAAQMKELAELKRVILDQFKLGGHETAKGCVSRFLQAANADIF